MRQDTREIATLQEHAGMKLQPDSKGWLVPDRPVLSGIDQEFPINSMILAICARQYFFCLICSEPNKMSIRLTTLKTCVLLAGKGISQMLQHLLPSKALA